MNFRTTSRLLAVPAVLGLVALATAGPASAHVTVTASSSAAGAYTVLTFSAGHGCDGSPTTKMEISIPEQILNVTPTRTPFWDLEVQSEKLAEPVTDAHGAKVTERDAVVVFTATEPLPDGVRDTFELSVQLPDAEGETLAFPVIQSCEKGETAWTEVASDGNADELESPAPVLTVTAAEGSGHGAAAGAGDAASDDTENDADSSTKAAKAEDDDSNWMGAVGLGAGLLGAVAGGVALARTRRTS
ncbi:YcnI family protein [Nocardioides sp. Bht2]|uniref:YcnI family copper-binding membrane protein n=1 Tax=Nocardioides sp. Bht2 TaxID=3392297 RepID=UPI0039B37AB4